MNKSPGRPRSKETKSAILKAAYDLLFEIGFNKISIEGIAKKAGVSKVTIYKWWNTKGALILDAFFTFSELQLPVPNTGSVKEDLYQQVLNLSEFIKSEKGAILLEFIGEGQSNIEFGKEYRDRYFTPRRLISNKIIERGIERGELKRTVDSSILIDLIFAPIFYRLLITKEKVDEDYITKIIDIAFRGYCI
ncbi:MAG: TetR family transcriptional regulator [Clostridiales bacterium 38-18]|nr:MAG: TetR family transcriptional regulator [Clostridiales bacterium 38-18]